MSSKGIGLLFIGIILGSAVGYGVSIVFPAYELGIGGGVNYRVEYEARVEQHQTLQDQMDVLTDNHDSLTDEFEALTSLYDGLDEDYTALMETYDDLLMLYEIINGTSPLTVRQISDDVILKEYAWLYDDETWTLSLTVPKDLYEYYTNRTRIVTEDYSIYVTHPNDDEYISTVVEAFYDIAVQEGYDSQQTVNLVIAFVQSLPYTSDDVTTAFDEYVRYPLETLVDGGGDCEDTSILTSALLEAMNNAVVLLNFPGHVAVGVNVDGVFGSYFSYEEENYYYLETTGEGWEIGVIPTDYQGTSAEIYPILPVAICTLDWAASRLGSKITIAATVKNEGTDDAKGLKIWAAFDGRNDEILNEGTSLFFDLNIEEEDIIIKLNVPGDIRTRLIVRVIDAFGNVMDEKTSEWFNTG